MPESVYLLVARAERDLGKADDRFAEAGARGRDDVRAVLDRASPQRAAHVPRSRG